MDKNFKPVYVRGTETGNGVIKALEQLGGINKVGHLGIETNGLYFICPKTHEIDYVFADTPYANYLEETAEEINPSRWRAAQSGTYYTIESTMIVIESSEYGDKYDNARYKCGNYFKTKEEAEKVAEKIKKILLS